MIQVNNFSKSYFSNSHKVVFSVNDISMNIEKGKITGLLGSNGSGKTTIMKAICGFHYPTEGKILISDNDENLVDASENPEIIKNLIGYVPEHPVLPPEMKVIDFLTYAGEIHGLRDKNLQTSIEEVVGICSLEKVLNKKIKTLSKGYGQRVSFAQAIIHNPPNLVLDEPVSGLDPAQILQMRELILKLSQTKAVLISTHILQEVTALCSDIYIISEGNLIINGTEKEIVDKSKTESLEQAFFKLSKSE